MEMPIRQTRPSKGRGCIFFTDSLRPTQARLPITRISQKMDQMLHEHEAKLFVMLAQQFGCYCLAELFVSAAQDHWRNNIPPIISFTIFVFSFLRQSLNLLIRAARQLSHICLTPFRWLIGIRFAAVTIAHIPANCRSFSATVSLSFWPSSATAKFGIIPLPAFVVRAII